jgi:hypothetical protein
VIVTFDNSTASLIFSIPVPSKKVGAFFPPTNLGAIYRTTLSMSPFSNREALTVPPPSINKEETIFSP